MIVDELAEAKKLIRCLLTAIRETMEHVDEIGESYTDYNQHGDQFDSYRYFDWYENAKDTIHDADKFLKEHP